MPTSKFRDIPIFATPFFLFLMYIAIYMFFEWALGISSTFVKQTDLFNNQPFEQLKETIFRSAWGISLIISSMVNVYLLCFCVVNIINFTSKARMQRLLLAGIFISSVVLFWYITVQDLGGGITGVIYKHIASMSAVASAVDYKLAINVTGGMGYVAVYLVSILLSYICFNIKHSPYHKVSDYLRMFKMLFFVTVTFLSTTIAQLFFQYQWLTVFISKEQVGRVDIAFVYPLIMSVFYVGIVVALFIPAAEILKRTLLNRTSARDEEITEDKVNALFIKMTGAGGIKESIKSFLLFASPILTVVVAELTKSFIGNNP